ncbi:MAG: HAD family hydrolase [Desulfovibrionaceae bacterium]
MTRWQAFVFDFDGVLADSVEVKTRAFEQLYLPHGPDVAARVVKHHRTNGGMPRREKFHHYQYAFLGIPATAPDLDRLCTAFSGLVVDAVSSAKEIPGAEAFLRHWSSLIPLYVDSASPDKELDVILRRRGLDHFFRQVYGSNGNKRENLAAILDHGGYTPDRVLFFGDATSDLKAARTCGTGFIGLGAAPTSPLATLAEAIPLFGDFHAIQAHLGGTPL